MRISSQPYADLIADGKKWIENRTWNINFRGAIAIHAGKGSQYLTKDELAGFPTGKIVAVARLTACVTAIDLARFGNASDTKDKLIFGSNVTWKQALEHVHAEGPWCWILESIERIEPVEAVGKQGLWNWEGQLEACR